MRLFPILATLILLFTASAAPAESDLIEDASFLRVTIGGKQIRLEALTVKRAMATGRLPIALIVHGKRTTQAQMSDQHAQEYAKQARDLARRGWLAVVVMRRGFGASDGPPPTPVTCKSPSFLERFDGDADELLGALSAVVQRPDADATRVVAIGVSAGGAAVTALSARNPPGLVAVINVSGGLRIEGCSKEDVLLSAIRNYGVRSRVPNLWIYAKNDSFFGPDLVDRMRRAFVDGGGDAKLVMLEPEGKDGHAIFSAAGGRTKWLPEMDSFLRLLKLPTWTPADVNALMQKLDVKERGRSFVERYIAAPTEKALARETGGTYLGESHGLPMAEQARQRALDFCQKTKPVCEIIMENDRWVAPGS